MCIYIPTCRIYYYPAPFATHVQPAASSVLYCSKDVFTHIAMPGFEAAGAVLGTIPLLISALEHYQHGMQALKKWRRYETVIQCLIRNINIERARLQNVCEKVLDGLVLSAQIDAMVKNPNGDLWTNEEIQEKIRARLWTSWTVFQQTLRDIQVAITYLSERVGDGSDVSHRNIFWQSWSS